MSNKFVKKPIPIEAYQWFKNGDHPKDYEKEVEGLENGKHKVFSQEFAKANDWSGQIVDRYRSPDLDGQTICKHCSKKMHVHGWVDTIEGGHIVCPSDWIITGVRGEHYPIKNDIFLETYMPEQRSNKMNFNEFQNNVEQWSKDRKIIPNSTSFAQMLKMFSEFGELCDAIGKGDKVGQKDGVGDTIVCLININALSSNKQMRDLVVRPYADRPNVEKELYRVISMLPYIANKEGREDFVYIANQFLGGIRILTHALGIDFNECLSIAWDEIKDRKGYLNTSGVFIKEE